MSLTQAPPSDRGESPLMSNNPFRNRIAQTSSPVSSRPISTNPFLDYTEDPKQSTSTTVRTVPTVTIEDATNGFAHLDLHKKPHSPIKMIPPTNGGIRRPENGAERGSRPTRMPFPGHRPTTSDEERKRRADAARRRPELDIFADPPELKGRFSRPRRNSDTSVMERASVLLDPEEARKQMERKRRESKRPSTSRKPGRKLDIIDKLDVTSIYGTGLFHHDGPFDACNPNRNRRRHRLAPIQAFPKDSENMKIGGSGPLNKKLDYDKYHGIGREAHTDYNEGAVVVDDDAAYFARPAIDRGTSFNATSRVDPIHADETAGLGTSTFLEGAPASRAAMQRRESELEQQQVPMHGLSRKKSLAQKIRGVRSTRLYSPDGEPTPTSPPTAPGEGAVNPFFKDYDKDYDQKGQQIALHEEQVKATRARAPSFPQQATGPERPNVLERTVTSGSIEAVPENKPSGLLGRMKSLKKGKPRTERREPS